MFYYTAKLDLDSQNWDLSVTRYIEKVDYSTMEFRQILQKLKYSDRLNSSMLTKELVSNIRHVQKTELLHILENLDNTVDINFQVKLLSILSAVLLFNNTNRDVIIKWSSIYDVIRAILARGLPMKTTVTLNFVTSLLYVDDDAALRSKTLTLHAQNMIRTSGCLTTMTNLLTNYMLYTDTWKALCRCIAEVCRGSEANQTFCSHLVPLCIQRCLRGTLDVLPVLNSIMYNHKHNVNMFLQTDGMSLFDRQDYLRHESCLQLFNTVIQNIDVEALWVLKERKGPYEDLQGLIHLYTQDSRIGQWALVNVHYLESKFKQMGSVSDDCNKNEINPQCKVNMSKAGDTRVNDTQMSLQNITAAVLSCPAKGVSQSPWQYLCKDSNKRLNTNDRSHRVVNETKLCRSKSNYIPKKFPTELHNPKSLHNEHLSFSFLMDDDIRCKQTDLSNKNAHIYETQNSTMNSLLFNINREMDSYSPRYYLKTSGSDKEVDFKPAYVSTPIKVFSKNSSRVPVRKSSETLSNVGAIRKTKTHKNVSGRNARKEKDKTKQKSMSSRLLEAINGSCSTLMRSVKNALTGNTNCNWSMNETRNKSDIQRDQSRCSYSFTRYMQKREAGLIEAHTEQSDSIELSKYTTNTCETCDDTSLLKRKFDTNAQLKVDVKKLKLGINLYGCDFKKISKTMWPRDKYMTPSVLYNLYRKLILK